MKTLNNNTNFSILEIEKLVNKIDWEKKGMNWLIPVITQDINTKEVLMQAYVNKESFENTLKSWNATYWSRSRNEIWEKWLTSGVTQEIYNIKIDCDRDSIIYFVEQLWEVWACHIDDQNSCFETDYVNIRESTKSNFWNVIDELFSKLEQRKNDFNSWKIWVNDSYTVKLLDKWLDSILKKVSEETSEVLLWVKNNDRENVIYEISDLLYFLNVLMVYSWIMPYQIANELERRFWVSWIDEKNSRKK